VSHTVAFSNPFSAHLQYYVRRNMQARFRPEES
jgi:hypothetical protein